MTDLLEIRIGVITRLAEKAPSLFGRTALMKFCYFLQNLRGVPLGYRFTLYSYGPFDSDVLVDLDTAEAMGAIEASVVYYTGGYGYEIKPSNQSEAALRSARSFLEEHQRDIDWVLDEFGGWNSSDLELASTVVYVEREAAGAGESIRTQELVQRVKDLKPRFTEGHITKLVEKLLEKKLLSFPK